MRVGNQEQICAKLDGVTALWLREMTDSTGIKKNRIINEAIKHYYKTIKWR